MTTVPSWGSATETLRTLGARMLERDADPALVARVNELLTEAVKVAEQGNKIQPLVAFPGEPDELQRYIDRSMMSGGSNFVAPPVQHHDITPERTVATVTVPRSFQGPPGRVHGGYVAALMDHIVGTAASAHLRPPYFTRVLTTSYQDAVPIEVELTLTARLAEHDGRKYWMDGEIVAEGTVRATARALMIQVNAS